MKDNIDKALEFCEYWFERLFCFAMLMSLIAIISIFSVSLFNQDLALIVACINISIGFIPFAFDILSMVILTLISIIIYGEY